MASTFTTSLGLEEPAFNDYVNTWENPVNSNFTVIDDALGGNTTQAFTNANVTFTVAQAAYYQIICTGALSGNVVLILPATIGGRRIITNNCTNAFTLTVKNGSSDPGGGIVCTQGISTPILLTQGRAYLDVPPLALTNLPAIPNNTSLGNVSGVTSTPTALTATQMTTMVNVFTSSLSGAAPASGGGTTTFLRADGSFAAIVGTLYSVQPPDGRLTLTSGVPVLASAVSAATSILFTPYVGQLVPIWNGANFLPTVFAETTQTLSDNTLSPAAAVANTVYDMFIWNNSGTTVCTRGPAWASSTARGTGAGTTQLTRAQGFLVNQFAITNGPAAGYGLYVGTIQTDPGGATVTFNPIPAAASGGPIGGAPVLLWNQFNRRPVAAQEQDSKPSWTWSNASYHVADAQPTRNVISFVTGQAEDGITATFAGATTSNPGAGHQLLIGIGLDSQTTPIAAAMLNQNAGSTGSVGNAAVTASALPVIGSHALYPLEAGDGSQGPFGGSTTGPAGQLMTFTANLYF